MFYSLLLFFLTTFSFQAHLDCDASIKSGIMTLCLLYQLPQGEHLLTATINCSGLPVYYRHGKQTGNYIIKVASEDKHDYALTERGEEFFIDGGGFIEELPPCGWMSDDFLIAEYFDLPKDDNYVVSIASKFSLAGTSTAIRLKCAVSFKGGN